MSGGGGVSRSVVVRHLIQASRARRTAAVFGPAAAALKNGSTALAWTTPCVPPATPTPTDRLPHRSMGRSINARAPPSYTIYAPHPFPLTSPNAHTPPQQLSGSKLTASPHPAWAPSFPWPWLLAVICCRYCGQGEGMVSQSVSHHRSSGWSGWG